MSADFDYDEMYKIVLVGDPGVGKTNLLAYFTAKPEDKELFTAICGCYSLVFLGIATMLANTTYGLYDENGTPHPPSPSRWVHL